MEFGAFISDVIKGILFAKENLFAIVHGSEAFEARGQWFWRLFGMM